MKRYHYDSRGIKLLYVDEAEPVCGQDFCDSCGECLACYDEDECAFWADGHFWVVYEDEEPEEEK